MDREKNNTDPTQEMAVTVNRMYKPSEMRNTQADLMTPEKNVLLSCQSMEGIENTEIRGRERL